MVSPGQTDPLELLLDLEVVDVQVNCVSGEVFLPIFLSPNTGICLSMRESIGDSEDGARRGFGRLTFSAGGRGSPPGDEWHCPMSTGGAFFFGQNGMSPDTELSMKKGENRNTVTRRRNAVSNISRTMMRLSGCDW